MMKFGLAFTKKQFATFHCHPAGIHSPRAQCEPLSPIAQQLSLPPERAASAYFPRQAAEKFAPHPPRDTTRRRTRHGTTHRTARCTKIKNASIAPTQKYHPKTATA